MTPTELLGRLWVRPVPPAVPLCSCGAPGDDSDGVAICGACLLRRADDFAAHPERFEEQLIVAAAEEHSEVLVIGSEPIDAHMHVTPRGIVIHETHRLAWRWDAPWPSDDRTLEDILEVASLERLWGRGRAA